MSIKVDSDKIRTLRKERYWSQEQLAEKADVSLRTIQRIENGGAASRESALLLASAFELEVADFLPAPVEAKVSTPELEAKPAAPAAAPSKGVVGLRLSLGIHLISFVIGMTTFLLIDLLDNPAVWSFRWPAAFWVMGLVAHAGALAIVELVQRTKPMLEEPNPSK